jgi:CheY-like chemotaxis protein
MKAHPNYIIVDDDPTNNMICTMTIKHTLGGVNTKVFTIPEEGLSFIKNNFNCDSDPTILLLDLDMPGMSGWQFLAVYETFNLDVKAHINIFLLSSSINGRDWKRAKKNSSVAGFLVKPMCQETILSIDQRKFRS